MRTHVARQIEEFLDGEVGGGDPFQDPLIGRVGRLGRASVLADERLDRRPVDDVEGKSEPPLKEAFPLQVLVCSKIEKWLTIFQYLVMFSPFEIFNKIRRCS